MIPKNLFLFCLICLSYFAGRAQNISVVTEQEFNFGSFYITGSSSGSVSISNTGSWSSSLNIQSVNSPTSAAIFTVSTDSSQPIEIQVDQPSTYLSNAEGDLLLLETGPANPPTCTIQQGAPAQIALGGNLQVPAQAKPGTYSGELLVRFTIFYE